MADIFSRASRARPNHWRGGALAASLVALSLVAAGCGSGGSSGSSGSSGSGGKSSSTPSSSSSAPSGTGGVTAGITAQNVSLPSGTPGKGKPPVTLGDKNFAEEYVLGDLYQIALQAKGYNVKLKPNIGGSEEIDTAFKSGQIDLYPEYLGEIVTSVAKKPAQKTDTANYSVAKKFEETQRNATILKETPFQDVDVLFAKSGFAKQHNLKSIPDLTNVGPKGKGVVYVAQPPSRTRFAGLVGLQKAYGLTGVKFSGAPAGQQYTAINKGQGNVGDAFSTDPAFSQGVKGGKYVALQDPKHIMGFQHVAPVVKKSVLKAQGPQFAQTLNWVNSLLTLKAIQALDVATQVQHHSEEDVAKAFLQANGLK